MVKKQAPDKHNTGKTADKATGIEAVISKALAVFAHKGWNNSTLTDIAQACNMTLAELHEFVDDKSDILVRFGRMIDREMLEAAEDIMPQNNDLDDEEDVDFSRTREILFDLLMERFDLLNGYRDGIVAVLNDLKFNPVHVLTAMPYVCNSMRWTLEAVGIKTSGWRGAARITGLTGVYLKTLKTWADDESPDLAKTMAALDKNLARAESWAGTLGL